MRIRVLRQHYCARCNIVKRSPRSTGVKLLLSVTDVKTKRVLDFGCGNWRNSQFLEGQGSYVVKIDAIPDTKPDLVAYPTHLPFRQGAFHIALYTHTLMFLEDKTHWPKALEEAARVTREYLVLETYHVKHSQALKYTVDDLLKLLAKWELVRRNTRRDMQNFVIKI